MKRIYIMAAGFPLLALVAMAQDDPARLQEMMKADVEKLLVSQAKIIGIAGAAMGPTVKGAPYSATEVTESNQVLADGTHIHNQSQTTVYRDSEGRMRRETPTQTTIMDPVAGVTYFLNPKTMTATKGTLSIPLMFRKRVGEADAQAKGFAIATAGGENATFDVRTTKDGTTSVTVNGKAVDPSTIKMEHSMSVNGVPVDEQTFAFAQDKMKLDKVTAEIGAIGMMHSVTSDTGMLRTRITAPGKTEALGKQMIEGVNADGSRVTTTLDAGAIGNDRPIQLVNERWYSSELQMVVMTKHSDPRTGEETFRLTNVSRSEPGADLFQVPPSYQILDRK